MEVSNTQEDETDTKDDDVVVVQEKNETITKIVVVENNKRPKRLSKQQRKALNKKNRKRKQSNDNKIQGKNLDSSKEIDVEVPNDDIDDIDTDIEAAEECIRIECMKTYDPIDIPDCLLYTSPSPRDKCRSRMPSSA